MKRNLHRCIRLLLGQNLRSASALSHGFRARHRCPAASALNGPFAISRAMSDIKGKPDAVNLAIGKEIPFEEETIPLFDATNFYPAKIGETLNIKYKIVAKLGFGTASTVWLARNTQDGTYSALKILASDHDSSAEIRVSDLIDSVEIEHPGTSIVRVAQDSFVIDGPSTQHHCLTFEPCGLTYTDFRNMMPDRVVDKAVLQQTLFFVVLGLDVLHQLGVVHTDLSPNNILLGVRDFDVFAKMERVVRDETGLTKVLKDRTIYQTCTMPVTDGWPKITDFGAAVIGEPNQKHNGDVMPNFHRAPEVILGMPWDSKIDIWSIGVMIWDLFEPKRLFFGIRDKQVDDEQHLAEMVALMGPPPKAFLERSAKCSKYWDAEGNWIAKTVAVPVQSFESREKRLEGEDKELLVTFARRVLRWLPEERPSASELFEDPFLTQFKHDLVTSTD